MGDLIRSQGSHPGKGYLPDRDDETCYQIGCWMERQEEECLKHQSLTPDLVPWVENGTIP